MNMTHWNEISEYIKIQNESYQNRCPKLYTLLYDNTPTYEVKTLNSNSIFDRSRMTINHIYIDRYNNDYSYNYEYNYTTEYTSDFSTFVSNYPFYEVDEFKSYYLSILNKIINDFIKNNDHIVAAGGSVMKIFNNCRLDHATYSDVDLFVIGERNSSISKKFKISLGSFIKKIYDEFKFSYDNNTYGTHKLFSLKITVTDKVINFIIVRNCTGSVLIKIQFILKIYESIGDLLCDFDLGSCQIAYTGHELITTPLGFCSIKYRINILNEMFSNSLLYINRIIKYLIRGYSLVIPQFEHTKIKYNMMGSIKINLGKILYKNKRLVLTIGNDTHFDTILLNYGNKINLDGLYHKEIKYEDPNFQNITNLSHGYSYYVLEYNTVSYYPGSSYYFTRLFNKEVTNRFIRYKLFKEKYISKHLRNYLNEDTIKEIYIKFKKISVKPEITFHENKYLSIVNKEIAKCKLYKTHYIPKLWRPEMINYISNKLKYSIKKADLIIGYMSLPEPLANIVYNKILYIRRTLDH